MRLFFKYLVIVLGLFLIASLDTAFFPALGKFWLHVNLTLIIGLFLVAVFDLKLALTFYLLTTLITVLTSMNSSFYPLIIGSATIVLIDWLFHSFFTNKSYYTLIALGIIGWSVYYILFALVSIVIHLVNTQTLNPEITLSWFAGILFAVLVALVLWTIAYLVTNYMSTRFKSYFIIGER